MAEEGFAVWITGLPASGKSTLAKKLKEKLEGKGIKVRILESDELRKELFPESTYSPGEREFFYNALFLLGREFVENGINVIFDATANKRVFRDRARERIKNFLEVYTKCSLEECQKRDPKGIYKKAEAGEANTVPGAQEPYEEPLTPDVIVETDRKSPEEGAEKVLLAIKKMVGFN